jgi:hypothetical protein
MNLSEVENPSVGTSVRSYWQTPGRVTSVREMRGDDLDRWAVSDHGQLLIRIDWDGGLSDEAPQSHMEWVAIRTIVWNNTLILVWLGYRLRSNRDHVSETTHGPMPHVGVSGRPSPPVRRQGAL